MIAIPHGSGRRGLSLDDLYRRHRRRWIELFSTSYLALSALLCVLAATTFALYVPMSTGRFLRLVAFSELALLVALGLGVLEFHRAADPIRRWLAMPPSADGAVTAWERAVQLPRLALRFALWRAVVLTAIPVTVVVAVEFDFSAVTVALFFVGLLAAATYPMVFFYFVLELYLRPLLRDLAAWLPADAEPRANVHSVRRKVRFALPLINLISGAFVGILATLVTGGSLVDLGLYVLFSLAIALTFSLVLTGLVSRALLNPVDDLLEATQRISAGDLTTRAAVVGADEMGRLAASFNRMTRELVDSRQRLVEAREEERRRLRRDLHDGLGPDLAALILQVDTARRLLERDAKAADALLGDVRTQAQAAVEDIRRLVYALRPPALDEFGLVRAIREGAAAFDAGSSTGGCSVQVDAPPDLPLLPAAVEVAIYRIVQEALTNVARHSGASNCRVRLAVNGRVEVEVSDDGRGFAPGSPAGVGLVSMRERAAEVGGRCEIHSRPGAGTTIRAWLPSG